MNANLCLTCGNAISHPRPRRPRRCPICEDERQYVRHGGQQWTTLGELQTSRDSAIGQRAMLVRTSDGNLRWDCVALLDEETIGAVRDLGGIAAIPISHPHSYTAMVEWSAAFGGVPIHLHEAARACAGRLISGAGSDCGLSAGSN